MRGVRLLDLATTMSLIYFPPSLVVSEARSKPGGFFLGVGGGGEWDVGLEIGRAHV